MKISLNWIKKYIDIELTTEELLKSLTNIGFDIESVENQADKYDKIVIGKVIEKKKHPNADKLSLCNVDIGSEVLSVVCGAPNVDAGQIICFAKVGAIIPNGGFELKKAKIRGEISEGMICSAKELNLGDDHSGIMVLEDKIPIGHPFAEYIGDNDVIIEIAITPNRGDLLSHFGVAREIGAILDKKISSPEITLHETKDNVSDFISVEIKNPEVCYRYCGRLVRNIKLKESPEWLKKYLTAVGLRPINNVVDISNFVMLECGQPLHTFDYDNLTPASSSGDNVKKKIIVRNAGNLEKFTTLDGKERKLGENILLICDDEKPVALAGIMGGENSEITENTKNVFIESAYFDPVVTRKSSKFLGLQTDSSYRFERGVDLSRVDWACDRSAQLISELGDGEIVSGLIDNYPKKLEVRIIPLNIKYVNKVIGIDFDFQRVTSLLEKIDVHFIEEKEGLFFFEVPFSRYEDLMRDIDIIEEIARLSGYENISGKEYDKLYFDSKEFDNPEFSFLNELRKFLVGRGFKEILTDSLVGEKNSADFNGNLISIINPSSQEMNVLRNNLFIGALKTVRNNFNFKSNSLKLFEIGEIFEFTEDKETLIPHVKEQKCLLITIAGDYDLKSFNQKSRYFDILDLKGELKALLEKLNIDNYKLNYYNYADYYEFKIDYVVANMVIASIYSFSKEILNQYDIEKPVLSCEIFVQNLINFSKSKTIYSEISKFPPVLRDLSLIVPRSVKISQLEEEMKKEGGKLLKKLDLYDIYELTDKESDSISYTFSLEFSSDEKTLTDDEINEIQERIIKNLNKKLNAELRT
jgi:phenylalanyl-tRNA synthetase beta chain